MKSKNDSNVNAEIVSFNEQVPDLTTLVELDDKDLDLISGGGVVVCGVNAPCGVNGLCGVDICGVLG